MYCVASPHTRQIAMIVAGVRIYKERHTSCDGRCNHSEYATCRCDINCVSFGDCCFDYVAMCGEINEGPKLAGICIRVLISMFSTLDLGNT